MPLFPLSIPPPFSLPPLSPLLLSAPLSLLPLLPLSPPQFTDHNFAGLSGVRVVRIATHPDFQRMGYGTRALQLLTDYFSGKVTVSVSTSHDTVTVTTKDAESADLLHEVIAPRKSLPPLLSDLNERQPEAVDYIGVSFGLTSDLLRYGNGGVHLCVCAQSGSQPTRR